MYILNDLWHGNISPCEKFICSDSEYMKLFTKYVKDAEQIRKALSPEKQEKYDEIEELRLKLTDISEQDSFIVGFRLGARLILDIVGEYKRQFSSPTE